MRASLTSLWRFVFLFLDWHWMAWRATSCWRNAWRAFSPSAESNAISAESAFIAHQAAGSAASDILWTLLELYQTRNTRTDWLHDWCSNIIADCWSSQLYFRFPWLIQSDYIWMGLHFGHFTWASALWSSFATIHNSWLVSRQNCTYQLWFRRWLYSWAYLGVSSLCSPGQRV